MLHRYMHVFWAALNTFSLEALVVILLKRCREIIHLAHCEMESETNIKKSVFSHADKFHSNKVSKVKSFSFDKIIPSCSCYPT